MNSINDSNVRATLLTIISRALASVNGRECVASFLTTHALPTQKVRVVAIGKAAASMLQGALDQHAQQIEAALVITKAGHTQHFAASSPPITQLVSAHPYPDQRSLLAGKQLLDFIAQTAADTGLLFLISGGTSSLVEVLPETIDAAQLHEMNRWLLARGWPIDVMNHIRKSVSLIKAGRLATRLNGRTVMQLLISDVPGDDLSVIGSGLLLPSAVPAAMPGDLPDWLGEMQTRVPQAPPATAACFATVQSYLVASNARLREAVIRHADALGLTLRVNMSLSGDAATQGGMIAHRLLEGPAGIYIWGGETVVALPAHPGQGGRCQHLALAAARVLAGNDNVLLLAVGTDGSDGPGEVAGALVDGGTLLRARDAGAVAADIALRLADAGSFLAASGDLVDTGPTGTNVMDLVIGLKYET